jgi:hypothetical protein
MTKIKVLHLRRHSNKDGSIQTIGFKGLELARSQGELVNLGLAPMVGQPTQEEDEMALLESSQPTKRRYDKLFHGHQIQNAQTALAFCQGLGYTPRVMPIVWLGDDSTLKIIATPEFNQAVADGLTFYAAIRQVHKNENFMAWAEYCRMAVIAMFDAMKNREIGVGFFYGIPIELAAWACGADEEDQVIWTGHREMEGLVFVWDQQATDKPAVFGKIGNIIDPDKTEV